MTLLDTSHGPFRGTTQLFELQKGATGANSGKWEDIRHVKDGSIEFFNDAGTGSISAINAQVEISNALNHPADSTDGTPAGAAVTALGVISLPSQARWIKVKVASVTASGGGTLGVHLHAHNY